jgi:predicted ATPase/class 3 adenylate cyclase
MTAQTPSGTVTFLLTDLQGSTRLWEQNPDAMKAAMVRHDEILEKTIAAHSGYVFARMGDGMAAAFSSAGHGVSAAAAINHALAEENWRTAAPLKARIGLHTAEAVIVDDSGYASLPINRCSRLMSAAHGGQIVISGATEALVRDQLPANTELIDLGEHRLRDLGSPIRVFQLSRVGLGQDFPRLRSLDAFPGNLPAQVSSFIGREPDIARVVAALGESRIATITGVGGVGKTRLAIQVAADLLPRYRDGAWLVELAPIRDATGVGEAVAAAFHLARAGGQSREDSLIELLASKQLLLVLDNCEHLLGSTARLVSRIERSCPGVAVLATSREGMAIEGEHLIALPPLNAGTPEDDPAQLVQTDAVNLFVERTRRVKTTFALTPQNTRVVVEVCQRLDGVPLAIELAAARLIAMSPADLLARLDRRFKVLAGGRRGAVGRHATLRAAIDWSYELLDAAEQVLLARMAVFSGGCTLEAIEQICSGGGVERDDILDLITSLVSRSLVIADDSAGSTRYRLLETIREYAEERLAERGEMDDLILEHARFYAVLAAHAAENGYGPEQLVWARKVMVDRENLRAAVYNAIDIGDAALAIALVIDYPHRHNQATTPMGESLVVPAGRVVKLANAAAEVGYPRALAVAAFEAGVCDDYERAEEFCSLAMNSVQQRSPQRRDPRVEIDVNAARSQIFLARGAFAEATSAYWRAAEVAETHGKAGLSAIYRAYGVSAALVGNVGDQEAASHARTAVALARQSGMPGAIVLSLISMSMTLVGDDPARARALLLESIERAQTPDGEITQSHITACLVAALLRDWRLTLQLVARSMSVWRWNMVAALQAAPFMALCARAIAQDQPEMSALLQGAARTGFRSNSALNTSRGLSSGADHFFVGVMREATEIVDAALGAVRRRELQNQGGAMTTDEAVSYTLANLDPALFA